MDFVAYGDKGIRAFEVKRTSRISSALLKGLKYFNRQYHQAKSFFVYGGKRKMREGNIEIIPIMDALKNLPELLS